MYNERFANGVNRKLVDNQNQSTFKTLVRYGLQCLRDAEVSEPVTSARMLTCYVLGWSMTEAIRRANEVLDVVILHELEALLARRIAREPLQYIVGEAVFYDHRFLCDKRALIPRPETELLVHEALSYVKTNRLQGLRVADIGTGSGVIAITFKLSEPNSEVVATDISADTLKLARANAARLKAEVQFQQGTLLEALSGEFEIIISNPPYIKSEALAQLQPEIAFEPTKALDGGADGMAVVEPLLRQLPNYLKRHDGFALIEIDPPISAAAQKLARKMFPHAHVEVQKDFNSLERILRIVTL